VRFPLRAGRGTNLALLVLTIGAFVTGGLAFAIGGAWAFGALGAHGALGLALVLLAPWKSVVSARGLRRARPGTPASVLLALLVVIIVASGIAHAMGLWTGGLAIQFHVGAALLSIPLAIWHVVARPVRPRPSDLSRRSLLRAGAVAGGGIVAFGAIEGLERVAGLAGTERRATGSYERGSFDPSSMPVTQWLDDQPPEIDPADWRLIVRTSEGESTLSYDELAEFPDRMRATVDCTGGWFATQDWTGVRLDRLVSADDAAASFVVVSATGYGRRFPIDDAGSMLLATRAGGRALSAGHGFPTRLVAPGRRGFWWVKWIERIETSATPWWWQSPFPLT
jgi:Oxidoreductase molybdopterin binding domain